MRARPASAPLCTPGRAATRDALPSPNLGGKSILENLDAGAHNLRTVAGIWRMIDVEWDLYWASRNRLQKRKKCDMMITHCRFIFCWVGRRPCNGWSHFDRGSHHQEGTFYRVFGCCFRFLGSVVYPPHRLCSR